MGMGKLVKESLKNLWQKWDKLEHNGKEALEAGKYTASKP